jgi:hypothetical protein
MDVIMFGEYTGKSFGKKKKRFFKHGVGSVMVWGYEDTWQSQEWEIFILSKA